MKNKWLIGLDLDGTTVTKVSEWLETGEIIDDVHSKNIEVISKLKELGHEVVILTGRPWIMTSKTYELLGLDGYVALSSGAIILDPKNEFKQKNSIEPNELNEFLNFDLVKNKFINGYFVNENAIVINKNDESLFVNRARKLWSSIEYNENVSVGIQSGMILLDYDKNEIQDVIKNINEKFGHFMTAVYSFTLDDGKTNIIEINLSKFNKGTAIEFIAEKISIPNENIIVIGDNFNDVEMFARIENSVAMKNATDEIKSLTKFVTDKENSEGGVGFFLEKFFSL